MVHKGKVAFKNVKRCSTSLTLRKIQIKTTMMHPFSNLSDEKDKIVTGGVGKMVGGKGTFLHD